ncbi:MAG: hypothetical protein NC115_09555 [Bacteroidales bacterium]|nr:hypothetical protein [Bacteroides sp.]MCM1198269.1 hypothetical protein [Clostridium sp.]MCM1502895.1 hypothetical protein [Bacteroidales bacterium]
MKKIALLLFTSMLMAMGGNLLHAQGKYGADSAECIKYLSYYNEYFKQKNYDEATPNWRKAFKLCPPTANHNMLINGTKLVRDLINKNKNNAIYRESLVDTLMMLHDIRAQYYPKYAQTALNNKGMDMVQYIKNDNRKLFDGFSEIISANGEKTLPQIFLFQLNAAVALYKDGVLSAEEIIEVYETSMENLEKIEASAPSDNLAKIKGDVENLFISSKVASCESLVALFTPRYEANPEDLDLAKNIVRMLSTTEDCTDNELFINAASTMYRLEPSVNSAYFLYKLHSSRGDVDNAIKLMQEAIDYPESDDDKDADYYFELAAFCFKNGRNSAALGYATRAAQLDTDSNVKGKAYMLAGTIWGSTVCKGNEIEMRAPYWVAVDFMSKAKEADASLAEECNKMIAQYRAYFPQAAEAFMYDLTDGQSYTVSCNGLKATTTVRTQK